MLIETLTQEILKVALKETEFDSLDKSEENSFLASFALQVSVAKN